MRGQLYRGHAKALSSSPVVSALGSESDNQGSSQLYRGHAKALSSSPVVSALGSESDDQGSSPGRGKALCPWDVREKKCELCF